MSLGRANVLGDGVDDTVAVSWLGQPEGFDDRRLIVRNGLQALELADDALGHDPRGRQPSCQALAHHFGVGGHEARIVGHAGDESL